uniref:Uncharacterized protein n=1 Tax=Arundo donax TaxID=35708 RepID=A0A0A9HJL5_ARUDO
MRRLTRFTHVTIGETGVFPYSFPYGWAIAYSRMGPWDIVVPTSDISYK